MLLGICLVALGMSSGRRWRAPTASGGGRDFLERSAQRPRGAQPGQCCAQQTVEGSLLERRFALQLLERGTDLSFAKAELAQGGEDLGPKLEQLRPHVPAILRAVGMADAERATLACRS